MWFRKLQDAFRAKPWAAIGVAFAAGVIVIALLFVRFRPVPIKIAEAHKPAAETQAPMAVPGKVAQPKLVHRSKGARHLASSKTHTKFAARKMEIDPQQEAIEKPSPSIEPVPALPLTPTNPALVSFQPTSELLIHGPANAPKVALTFDAGSDAKAVPLILKTLEERHVHATFFLTGRFCEKFPNECKAIADAGMELGNHSYWHPRFTRLSDAKILEELDRAEAAIVKACGRGAKPLFRFPYGDSNARTQRVVAAAGYQPIHWTLDSLDAFGKPKTADFVAARIDGRIKPGFITLMHVSCVTSAEALPRIFGQLDKLGAQVVPVSELLLSAPPAGRTVLAGAKAKITQ